MIQQLGPLGQIDAVTSGELKDAMGHHFDEYIRDRFRGIKVMRAPIARVTAASGSFILAQTVNDGAPLGPEQGYIWNVRRVLVSTASLSDSAKYVLYAGSDTAATDPLHLLDGITTNAVTFPNQSNTTVGSVTSPAAGATITSQALGGSSLTGFNYSWTVGLSGTLAAGDANNFALFDGATQIAQSLNPAVAGNYPQTPGVALGGATLAVKAINVGTVGAVYQAQLTTTQIGQPLTTASGLQVNSAYTPANRSTWLFPGEQLYAAISGATNGAQYLLSAVVAEVPFEMMGKIQ